jgi:hypothetical protein
LSGEIAAMHEAITECKKGIDELRIEMGKLKRGKMTYRNFDPADYLDNDEVIAEYLTACAEDPNPEVLAAAFSDVARARGLIQAP